jgi:hypothetical protein
MMARRRGPHVDNGTSSLADERASIVLGQQRHQSSRWLGISCKTAPHDL